MTFNRGRRVRIARCPSDGSEDDRRWLSHTGKTGTVQSVEGPNGPYHVLLDEPAEDGGLDFCDATAVERLSPEETHHVLA